MSLTRRLRMASPLQKKEVSVSRVDAVEEEFIRELYRSGAVLIVPHAAANTRTAMCSAIIIVVRLVGALGMPGMMDASTTIRPSMP